MITTAVGDSLDVLKTIEDNFVDSVVCDPPYGLKFMGKKWDYDVPSVELWREVLRVLKPGGHLLSFGGTRTYHRMVANIEDAGFEIRDQLQWLYGSGFPKSLDVSKAIDKKFGAEREVVGLKTYGDGNQYIGGEKSGRAGMMSEGKPRGPNLDTAPSTPEAIEWQGFGTALKPANEPIVLARKPLSEKTVAANVLRWGCGGLNVDGCRVEYTSESDKASAVPGSFNFKEGQSTPMYSGKTLAKLKDSWVQPQGRWPANLILDEQAAEMLDEQSGVLKSGSKALTGVNRIPSGNGVTHGKMKWKPNKEYEADSGGASRFFYVAKASKRERNEGLGDSTNGHPTIKPIKLMRYLCRLITPPGGTVLDPFMGSGSTGVAALNEGFGFYGIDMNEEYCDIAKARLRYTAEKLKMKFEE